MNRKDKVIEEKKNYVEVRRVEYDGVRLDDLSKFTMIKRGDNKVEIFPLKEMLKGKKSEGLKK